MKKISKAEALAILEAVPRRLIPRNMILDEFRRGWVVELEHADVTDEDPVLTAMIALAHLRQVQDYYTRLDRYVER